MNSDNEVYTKEFNDVLHAESEYIAARRDGIKLNKDDYQEFEEKLGKLQDAHSEKKRRLGDGKVGLALSGGGIRSATFNLGLLQALTKQNILRFCDYLSTVSGGGYIGSCLSSLLDNPEASVEKDTFPFWFERNVKDDEREEVKWLRSHSKYLAPNTSLFSLDVWRMVGLYLSGLILTNITTVYLTILSTYSIYLIVHSVHDPLQFALWLFNLSLSAFVIMVIVRWLAALRNLHYKNRRIIGYVQGTLAITAALLAVVGSFILLAYYLPELKETSVVLVNYILKGGTAATALGLLTGLIKSNNKLMQKIRNVVFRVSWLMVLPVALALFVRLLWTTEVFKTYGTTLIIISIGLFVLSLFTNTNRISIHHFYRDRLSESYIIKRDKKKEKNNKIEEDHEEIIVSNEPLVLKDLHQYRNGAPYHLINTTLNIPGSSNSYLRGRNADFYLFSKEYIGSHSTGYRRTEDYEKGETRLATAMAISGAAASPQMGQLSSKFMTFILALLNIRLNRFMPNPDPALKPFIKLWPYYFIKELFDKGDEKDRFLNLSDGGHIENLGMYELIKRRCRLIIAADSGADPDFNYDDLANLLRKIRIDFGVEIELSLENLRSTKDERETAQHFAVGTIHYPKGPNGLIIYIKSSITGKESEDLLAYRRKNPTFPDESTADQFFDEAQFESYRELGYLTGKAVFSQ